MKKKLASLALALVMCLSLCIPAFADENATSGEIFCVGDIKVTISIEPIGNKRLPRMGNAFEGVARPSITHNYNLIPGDGNYVSHQVWNDATDDTQMDVSITITNNGGSQTFPYRLNAGNEANVNLSSVNGAGLNGRVTTKITAVNASSVPYSYIINQTWR